MKTLALVGVGKMGAPIAHRLQLAGYDLQVFDASAERRAAAANQGLRVRNSVAETGSGASCAMLCLPDASAVEAAICGPDGLLASPAPPMLIVDLTSSSPSTTIRLASLLGPRGITLIDAPMSGGVAGARAGTLTVMVGGDGTDCAPIKPILESFAVRVISAGPLGSGHAAKAVNNALSALALTVTAETLAIGQADGWDATRLLASFNHGCARSQSSEVKFPRFILTGTYASEFLLSQMLKDIGVACQMAADLDVPVPMTALIGQVWRAALAALGPGADATQIAQFLSALPANEDRRPMGQPPTDDASLETMNRAIFAACWVGAIELLRLGDAYQLDRARLLAIINESTGRSQATRDLADRTGGLPGATILTIRQATRALDWTRQRAGAANLAVPTTALAAERLRQAGRTLSWETDLFELAAAPAESR